MPALPGRPFKWHDIMATNAPAAPTRADGLPASWIRTGVCLMDALYLRQDILRQRSSCGSTQNLPQLLCTGGSYDCAGDQGPPNDKPTPGPACSRFSAASSPPHSSFSCNDAARQACMEVMCTAIATAGEHVPGAVVRCPHRMASSAGDMPALHASCTYASTATTVFGLRP